MKSHVAFFCFLSRLSLGTVVLISLLIAGCSRSHQPPPARRPASKQERPVHVFAVGDIMLADAAQTFLDKYGYDYPFRRLKGYFKGADVLVGNLEVPITQRTVPLHSSKTYIYQAQPQSAQALKDFGFDLLCLANNHALDYGIDEFRDTIKILGEKGIRHFGAGNTYREAIAGAVVELAGIKIGFLGFMEPYGPYRFYRYFATGAEPGVAKMSTETVREAIYAMRPHVDVLVVSFHWGRNYKPVTSKQKKWGKQAVVYGADLVIGHHPHVAQGVEVYQGVPILYSLGNFTFGTPGRFRGSDQRWHYGWIADITLENAQVTRVDLMPIETDNQAVGYQPRVADAGILPKLLPFLNEEFGTQMEIVGERARLRLSKAVPPR
ncbi:CapA family protein [Candidatus Poribacteria bacterium]|nr:CapA family protein [Candidatus Poribacteria bacterium]